MSAFPSGWYAVAFSHELARGQIVERRFMGRKQVVFRGASGAVAMLDAHCPQAAPAGGGRWAGRAVSHVDAAVLRGGMIMATFRTEHVFRAPSVAAVFDAYFDPEHQAEQDRLAQLVERTVLEREDDGNELRMVSRVVPERQYPGFVRGLVSGPLSYTETLVWRRRDHEIEMEIRPSLLTQRMRIATRYRLTPHAEGEVHRVFEGDVTVDLALVGGRVAKWTAAEIERSAAASASCTQAWLDRLVERQRASHAERK